MNIKPLRDYFYPICLEKELVVDKVLALSLFGVPLVLYLDESQQPTCVLDLCPHRSTALSAGKVVKGELQCPYHGWRFGKEGLCTHVPSVVDQNQRPRCTALSYPCEAAFGLIWVKLSTEKTGGVQDNYGYLFEEYPKPQFVWFLNQRDVQVNYDLLIENTLDATHFPFTHGGLLAKSGINEPMSLNFLDYSPGFCAEIHYPLNPQKRSFTLQFDPPNIPRFKLTRQNGSRMDQMIFCTPLEKNKTRIFYFVFQDFLKSPFLRPLVNRGHVWFVNKLLSQDDHLIRHQEKRIQMGARAWNMEVPCDRLAKHYRNWIPSGEPWFDSFKEEIKIFYT